MHNNEQIEESSPDNNSKSLSHMLDYMVLIYGSSIQYVPKYYITDELCTTAVNNDERAFVHIPDDFKTEMLCFEAICFDYKLIEFVPDSKKTLVLISLCNAYYAQLSRDKLKKFHSYCFKYLPDMLKTEEWVNDAAEMDDDYCIL